MATPLSSGVFTSTTTGTNQQVQDIEKVLQVLKPYQTPLVQWLWFYSQPAKPVVNPTGKFSWFESEFLPHQAQLTSVVSPGSSAGSLRLTATNVNPLEIFNTDDIVLLEALDKALYVESTTPSEVILKSMDPGSEFEDIDAAGSFIKIIGSRNSEYNGIRKSINARETEHANYLNIFTESIATSGRAQAGEYYTDGLTHDEQVEKKIEEMKLQIERYFLFAPAEGYATIGNYRTTWGHGLMGRIKSNINSYSGALSETVFDTHLKKVFARGSNRKLHLCGSDQLAEINKFVKDRYHIQNDLSSKMYGLQVNSYVTPFGIVDLMWDPVMDGKYSSYGFTVDAERIRMRFMSPDKKGERKFRIEEGVETPGVDGTTTKILFDVGIEIHNEATHGLLRKS